MPAPHGPDTTIHPAGASEAAIRPAVAADAASVARLSADLGYPTEPDVMRARLERLAGLEDHAVFVACRGDEVVGWIHVLVAEHLQAESRAEIGGLVVAPGCRGEGLGGRLVASAEQWARRRGLPNILVRSQIAREAAHRFYRRQGYTPTKTSAVFAKPLPGDVTD
jgi:GNAT superfamily N-acetyltransferase